MEKADKAAGYAKYSGTYLVSVYMDDESANPGHSAMPAFAHKHLIDLVIKNSDVGLAGCEDDPLVADKIREMTPRIASIVSRFFNVEIDPSILRLTIQPVSDWIRQKEETFNDILRQSNIEIPLDGESEEPYIVRMYVERAVGDGSTGPVPVFLDDVIVHARDENDAIETVQTAIERKVISADVYGISITTISPDEISMRSIALDQYLESINSELVAPFFKQAEPTI